MLNILGCCSVFACFLYQTQFGRRENVTFYSPSEVTCPDDHIGKVNLIVTKRVGS